MRATCSQGYPYYTDILAIRISPLHAYVYNADVPIKNAQIPFGSSNIVRWKQYCAVATCEDAIGAAAVGSARPNVQATP